MYLLQNALESFKKIANQLGLSDTEKSSVFYDCAKSTYKL